ncbi:Myosin-15 [Myotis davidii]|uniref:Myosin-15 n=1 Tax=Myotis davidii TaxID=225400 RepID=L5M4Z2_MYODS|nr:Myosin-15 [Myotis davidii]
MGVVDLMAVKLEVIGWWEMGEGVLDGQQEVEDEPEVKEEKLDTLEVKQKMDSGLVIKEEKVDKSEVKEEKVKVKEEVIDCLEVKEEQKNNEEIKQEMFVDMLLVSEKPSDFHFCCHGEVAVESSDDAQESPATDQGMDILGILPEEKYGFYKLIGAILHLGNMKFKQTQRRASAEKAAFLMGINSSELVKGLIHPRIKVGNDFVTRGQNIEPPEKKKKYEAHLELVHYAGMGDLLEVFVPRSVVGEHPHILVEQLLGRVPEDVCQVPVGAGTLLEPHLLFLHVSKQCPQRQHSRFCILNLKVFPKSKLVSSRKVAEELLGSLEIAHTQYHLGITKEQETLANAEEQFELLIKSKIQLEARVKALSIRVEEEAEINSELTARGRKLEDECSEFKKEIDDLETILVKSQKEKCATEHKAKNLSEEMESLNEDISKLNEVCQQTLDDLYTEQEKLSNLSKANLKLKQQVDEFEGALEQERKAKMNMKGKGANWRAISSCTRRVWHLESSQLQLTEKLRRKELEMSQMNSKVEHEKDLVAQLQQMVKELQVVIYQTPTQIQNLKEELEVRRTTQTKVERDRADLTQELEDLNGRLGQAEGDSLASGRKLRDRKRNYRSFKRPRCTLRQLLKFRHAYILTDRRSQVEDLQQIKQKLEKDKSDLQLEVDDHLTHVEQMTELRREAAVERRWKAAPSRGGVKAWVPDEFLRRLEEKEALINQLSKEKSIFIWKIEGLKGQLEEDIKAMHLFFFTNSLTTCLKKNVCLVEQEAKAELLRALSKGKAEMLHCRMKYEDDAIYRTEDLEDANPGSQNQRRGKLLSSFYGPWTVEEISNLTNQLREENKKLSEMEKVKKEIEQEKSEVQVVLEEAERNVHKAPACTCGHSFGEEKPRAKLLNESLLKQLHPNSQETELDRIRGWSRIEATQLKRNMEGDLSEMALQLSCANQRVSEATMSLGQLQIEIKKKKLEVDVARMQKEAREAMWRCRNAEEKAKKTAAEVANMSEELKKDQDANAHLEKMKSNMVQTIKDIAEEGKTYLSRMQTLMDNLQLNVRSYKQQIEAAEAQANQYLSKYKKQQCELNEAKERAEIAESQVNKLKIKVKEFGKKVCHMFNSVLFLKKFIFIVEHITDVPFFPVLTLKTFLVFLFKRF